MDMVDSCSGWMCGEFRDISWDSIGKYGELTVYDRTDRSEVVSRIGDAEIITTNKTVIDRAVIEACPNLRYIGKLATGYNVVDVGGGT